MHSRVPRNRRIYAFEIHEIQWVLQFRQFPPQFRTEPRLPRLHTRTSSPLWFAQGEVIRNIVDGFDSHLREFLYGARVEPWQVADVVGWTRLIATVVELARDGIGAMPPRRDVRSLGHCEDSKLRP